MVCTKCFGTENAVEGSLLRAAAWEAFESEGCGKVLAPLEAVLAASGAWLVGGKCSAADVCRFSNMHLLVRSGADADRHFAKFPAVKKLYDAVMNMGGMKAHCDLNLNAYYVKK